MLGASEKEFSTYVALFAPRRASYIRQQEDVAGRQSIIS